MKAIALTRHGGPEFLEPMDVEEPRVGPSDVLVRVVAVALNHLDIWVRRGFPGLHLEFPHLLGSDVSGTVEGFGSEVTDVAVGSAVMVNPALSCGHCHDCLGGRDDFCAEFKILGEHVRGGYAEKVAVPRANVVAAPRDLSPEESACVPLTYMTAWNMLVERARLRVGEVVLVQSAASGVGTAAVQIAKSLGATVIATASTPDKLARAIEWGADSAVNYDSENVVSHVKNVTRRGMVDVVFEHVGAKTFQASIDCLKRGGRLVTCGATSGAGVSLDLRVLFHRRISLLGATLGPKSALFQVLQLLEKKRLRPAVGRVLPLKDAAEAHRVLESRRVFGKVVLVA